MIMYFYNTAHVKSSCQGTGSWKVNHAHYTAATLWPCLLFHLVKSDFKFHLMFTSRWLDFLVKILFVSGHSLKWVATYLFNASLAYGLAPKLTSSLALMARILEFVAKSISKHWLLLIMRRKCSFLKTYLHWLQLHIFGVFEIRCFIKPYID